MCTYYKVPCLFFWGQRGTWKSHGKREYRSSFAITDENLAKAMENSKMKYKRMDAENTRMPQKWKKNWVKQTKKY